MELICYNEDPEATQQKVADTLQAALSRIVGLDMPDDKMMTDHAFIVEKDGGLDYMWGTEKKMKLLMSTRPLLTAIDGVRIITNE